MKMKLQNWMKLQCKHFWVIYLWYYISVNLINKLSFVEKYSYNFGLKVIKTFYILKCYIKFFKDTISGLYQEYKGNNNGDPLCDRKFDSGKNMVDDPTLWKVSIPHPVASGICYTYK